MFLWWVFPACWVKEVQKSSQDVTQPLTSLILKDACHSKSGHAYRCADVIYKLYPIQVKQTSSYTYFPYFSPSAFTHPCEVFTGFPGWWICLWFIRVESTALLGSISRSAVLDVSMLTSCFWCLARQSSFIHLLILESPLYTVQIREGK